MMNFYRNWMRKLIKSTIKKLKIKVQTFIDIIHFYILRAIQNLFIK